MTTCSRGDIVLVDFVFADEKGDKQRPGLLVSSARYHRSRREAILAAITSQVGRALVGDYRLERWKEAGPPPELEQVEAHLRVSLALPGT